MFRLPRGPLIRIELYHSTLAATWLRGQGWSDNYLKYSRGPHVRKRVKLRQTGMFVSRPGSPHNRH